MRLSICIPTYNRGPFIGALFDSILAQQGYDCEIEVVVSDNASTDQTPAVVKAYRNRLPGLIYHRAPENLGADRNFLKVVALATGDFCWLMGSDDILEPGSIAEIARHCHENGRIAGLSVNRNAYNYTMTARIFERPVAGGLLKHDQMLSTPETIFAKLGEYFGYLSGQVVNRTLWDRVIKDFDVTPYFNAYVHIYVIGEMLKREPHWFYINKPCVGWRSDNDSFLSQGEFKRMQIDVIGYEKISRGLFGAGSSTYHHINSTVASVHVRYAILGAKLKGLPVSFYRRAVPLLIRSYWRYPAFWMHTAPLLLMPTLLMRAARWGYRRTLKLRRTSHLGH
jgi:abequosyltransferase